MEERNFIAKGAAYFAVDYDGQPRDVYFLLLPKLTMLALSSAVEPLRVANQITNKELYRWYLMSEDGAPVTCSNGISIAPDSELQNIPKDSKAFICSGVEPFENISPRVMGWVNRQYVFGRTVGSICTGAFTLAKAGLLNDKTFTLHWENQPSFMEYFPELQPTGSLYEIDGELMTCGGGNAALDMMLHMIEQDHGKDLATVVSDMCIHFGSSDRETSQQSAYSVAIKSGNQHLIGAMQYMLTSIEDPVEIHEIAEQIDLSRRQMERLFKRYVGVSPVKFYIKLRVERAYALLNETSMPIPEIAAATGFNSASQLAFQFKKRFGLSPTQLRKG
ncbi:GlxA family transcriptional regulator [Kiloniella sp. b19]|uniref:GlxA family transcriptional regulator n=1 Tax=Kiloniella sp. GXU_MW_B19 TaxID=3141326 RepID=UPI0031D04CDD